MTVTQEQFSSVKEDIRTLSAMVVDIKETVADHTYRLSLMRAQLGGIDLRLGNMERRIDGRLDKVDGRLDGLESAVSGLQDSVSGLQDSVSEILTLVRKSS